MKLNIMKLAKSCNGILVMMIILCALALLQGCESKPSFQTEYQAVFLDNGQVFFGKISETGTKFPLLNDVFYVQSAVNNETKQVSNILVKRGSEWHGPNLMRLNAQHIILIEPVAADSRVAQLIAEANKKK